MTKFVMHKHESCRYKTGTQHRAFNHAYIHITHTLANCQSATPLPFLNGSLKVAKVDRCDLSACFCIKTIPHISAQFAAFRSTRPMSIHSQTSIHFSFSGFSPNTDDQVTAVNFFLTLRSKFLTHRYLVKIVSTNSITT